jgi:hypothetical protein
MQSCPPSQPAPERDGRQSGCGRRQWYAAVQVPEPRWAPRGAVPPVPPAAQQRWGWRWPLVALGMVLGSALVLFVVSMGLGAGFNEVDDAGRGGTVQIGATFTDESGLGLTVSNARMYYVDNESIVGPDEQAYEVVVTVVNGTTNRSARPSSR